ncbi:MAG: hypothetical protein Q4G30_01855 [Actinomycetaceae bacterium]|nr:hypothetical protein [Actinomycetaceae bacterium]
MSDAFLPLSSAEPGKLREGVVKPRRNRYLAKRPWTVWALGVGVATFFILIAAAQPVWAVVELAVLSICLSVVRGFRPSGTWMAARSALFDRSALLLAALALGVLALWLLSL